MNIIIFYLVNEKEKDVIKGILQSRDKKNYLVLTLILVLIGLIILTIFAYNYFVSNIKEQNTKSDNYYLLDDSFNRPDNTDTLIDREEQ